MKNHTPDITIGRGIGAIGRWFRLIIGLYFSLLITIVALLEDPITEALSFLGQAGLYFLLFLVIYLIAFRLLSGRVLGRTDPWIGTLIFLGPVTLIGAFELGPPSFRVGLSLYYSVSSVLNFAMSYGGCEVVALPSLIFRVRYTLYCPYNAVDVVENALLKGTAHNQIFGVLALAVTVFIGGYFLLVEDQGMIRQFYPIDVPNQLALILLVPVAFIAKRGWETYQTAGKQWIPEVKAYVIGGLVLFVLMVMFVLGVDAFPLWYFVFALGGLLGVYRLLQRRSGT